MAHCSPGDQVVCKLKDNSIVSALTDDWDEEAIFEIVSQYEEGYLIYIPIYSHLKDCIHLTSDNHKKFNADRRFIDSSVYYITDYRVAKIYRKVDGMTCSKCNEFYQMSEANQPNGTLICWNCKNYPFYK